MKAFGRVEKENCAKRVESKLKMKGRIYIYSPRGLISAAAASLKSDEKQLPLFDLF